jgi:hypothetical protein
VVDIIGRPLRRRRRDARKRAEQFTWQRAADEMLGILGRADQPENPPFSA